MYQRRQARLGLRRLRVHIQHVSFQNSSYASSVDWYFFESTEESDAAGEAGAGAPSSCTLVLVCGETPSRDECASQPAMLGCTSTRSGFSCAERNEEEKTG